MTMIFTTHVKISVEIKNFERFDNIEFDYVQFTDDMKREISSKFEPKKFRLVFDLTNVDPEGDGYSIHATASHRKKAKFEIIEPSTGVFQLNGEAAVSVPVKISQVKASDFRASLIYCDLWKGTEDSVKLVFDAINISDFDLV